MNATDICRSVPLNKNLKADVCIDIPIIETSKNSPTFRVCPSIYGKIGLSKITVGLDFPCWYYEGQLVFKVEDLLDIKAWSNLIGTFVK